MWLNTAAKKQTRKTEKKKVGEISAWIQIKGRRAADSVWVQAGPANATHAIIKDVKMATPTFLSIAHARTHRVFPPRQALTLLARDWA